MPYVESLPQSGCTFTDPTQFVMMEFEFGSTGAEEISVFQRLLLVKGTKPLRLAACPVDIPLQARLLPPVPFPLPPFPPPPLRMPPVVCFETPEQAVRAMTFAMAKRRAIVLTRRMAFILRNTPRVRKRPFEHVPIFGFRLATQKSENTGCPLLPLAKSKDLADFAT